MTLEAGQQDPTSIGFRFPRGFLGGVPEVVSPASARLLMGHAKVRRVAGGTVLLAEGERPEEVGFVLEGMLGMVKRLPDGRAHLVGLIGASDHFGRIFDGPNAYAVESLTDTRFVVLPRDVLEGVLRSEPEAERRMLVHLLDELDAAREWLLLISGTRVIQRVASYLMVLLRRADERIREGTAPLHQPLSRHDLAHYLGTSRESISRALRQLAKAGAIRVLKPDRFLITDLSLLVDFAGQDLVMEAREAPHPAE